MHTKNVFLFICFDVANAHCFNRQEQCKTLADLLREYQILRASISSSTEGTGHFVDISSVLKDHEETRRSLAKVKSSYCVIFHPLDHFALIMFSGLLTLI